MKYIEYTTPEFTDRFNYKKPERIVHQLTGKVLEINGAGMKRRFIQQNGNVPVVDSNNNNTDEEDIESLYYKTTTTGTLPFHGKLTNSNCSTASAVVIAASAAPVTVMPVDAACEQLGIIDTHFFPINDCIKDYSFDRFVATTYKCAIVQEVNRQLLHEHFNIATNTEIDAKDIAATIKFFTESDKYIAVTDEQVQRDIAFVRKHYFVDTLDIWINGLDNYRRKHLVWDCDDPDKMNVPVYQYGRKIKSYSNIHTIDGDYCLRMPSELRDELQAWYNADKKTCMKFIKEKLSEVFVLNGLDKQGNESNWTSFKKTFCNRAKEALTIDYSNVKQHLIDFIDKYKVWTR